jgi:hypothetical protein
MNNNNGFLKEFLAMRKELKPSATTSPSPTDVLPKKDGGKKKAKPQMKKELETEKPGLMGIIENKPHKRVVIEYLQDRANDLSEEKMK